MNHQTFQKVNPMIPLVDILPGGISIGQELTITGSTHINATRFSINLQCGPNTSPRDDVALHITADFLRQLFVRNSIHGMSWGVEETYGGMSLSPGQQFRISILCEAAQFVITLNQVTYRMNHRIPFQRITHLTIDGDVIIHEIFSRPGAYANVPHGVAPYPSSGVGYVPNPYPPSSTGHPSNNYVQPNNKGPFGPLGGALGAGVIGSAIAARSVNPKKIAKHQKKMAKKALKYGLPIAGAGVGAYALSKTLHHGHHHHHHHGHKHKSSSSSSSSSSSD